MKATAGMIAHLTLVVLLCGGLSAEDRANAGDPKAAGDPEMAMVPVRVLAPPADTAANRAAGTRESDVAAEDQKADEFSATLPPQYSAALNNLGIRSSGVPEDPSVWFLLPLPERLILVEARLTIDGQPFRIARERRIEELLDELARPDADESSGDDSDTASPQGPPRDDSLPQRLRRYVQATQRSPNPDEMRWYLERWAMGPTLLMLDEHFQSARAHQAPLFTVLDRDGDQSISPTELAAAEAALLRYDQDQDEILTFAELAAAGRPAPADLRQPISLLPPLALLDALAYAPAFRKLAASEDGAPSAAGSVDLRAMDLDENGRLDERELSQLRSLAPELRIEVAFDSAEPSNSQLRIVSLAAPATSPTILPQAAAMTLEIAGARVEFSAVQSLPETASDQISVGAVRDGYPLLPIVDWDQNGRLTLRELRQAANRIRPLDRDRDGGLAAREIMPTVRVAFGLGPIVHQPLASLRMVHPPLDDPTITPAEWFNRMDRNQDGDLSVREFLGGSQKFNALDRDGDGLVSAAESVSDPDPNNP